VKVETQSYSWMVSCINQPADLIHVKSSPARLAVVVV
jgi:hypothetical protein